MKLYSSFSQHYVKLYQIPVFLDKLRVIGKPTGLEFANVCGGKVGLKISNPYKSLT